MKNWLPFEEAREKVREDVLKYNIGGFNAWRKDYVEKNLIPSNIPRHPYRTYKNSGWVSWGDWLGTKTIYYGYIKWLSFHEAHNFIKKDIKKYHINSKVKWYRYVREGLRPNNIPSDPDCKYKNSGWVSWGHWLGTKNKRGGIRKHVVNDNFFKKWSHDMAYILGFWFADGNIKRGKIFSIYQHNKDMPLMQKMLEKMSATYPIYLDRKNPHCYISICSKVIYDDIIKLGGIPAKSLTVDFPKIPQKYISSFLRGNFDGDGSIYYDNTNKKYYSCFTGGSKEFIYGIKRHLDKVEINNKIIKGSYYEGNSPFYYLRVNAIYTKKLGLFLYSDIRNEDSLKMNRKYKLFQLAKEVN